MSSFLKLFFFICLIVFVAVSFKYNREIIEFTGKLIGYQNCVACGQNSFLRGERLIDYKYITQEPLANLDIAQFTLCKSCFENPGLIDNFSLLYYLVYEGWDSKDIILIINKVNEMKKNKRLLI